MCIWATKQTNQNKAECRQQDKTQQGGMPPNKPKQGGMPPKTKKEAECRQQNNVQGGMPPNKQTKTLNAANAESIDAKHKRLFSPLKGQNLSLENGPQTLSPWSLRVAAGNIPPQTNQQQQGGTRPHDGAPRRFLVDKADVPSNLITNKI